MALEGRAHRDVGGGSSGVRQPVDGARSRRQAPRARLRDRRLPGPMRVGLASRALACDGLAPKGVTRACERQQFSSVSLLWVAAPRRTRANASAPRSRRYATRRSRRCARNSSRSASRATATSFRQWDRRRATRPARRGEAEAMAPGGAVREAAAEVAEVAAAREGASLRCSWTSRNAPVHARTAAWRSRNSVARFRPNRQRRVGPWNSRATRLAWAFATCTDHEPTRSLDRAP